MGMRVEAVWVDDGRARARPSRTSSASGRPASPTPTCRMPGEARRHGPRVARAGESGPARTDGDVTSDARRRHRRLRAVAPCAPRAATATRSRCSCRSLHEVKAEAGLDQSRDRLHLLGQLRLPGRAGLRFVMALDAVGAWPPISESHVEMDGAWALYEAWVKIQTGEADTALVYGFGKSSLGDLRDVLTRQLDPYFLAPLWPDASPRRPAGAGLLDAGARRARRWPRSRRAAAAQAADNPYAQLQGSDDPAELLEEPEIASPLRRHDCPPISDGAAAVVLAAGDVAREIADDPAWIRGIDHRIEPTASGVRDLTVAAVGPPRRREGGRRRRAGRRGRAARAVHPPGAASCGRRSASATDVSVNPSGGALAANPMMVAGLIRIGEAAGRIRRGEAGRAVAHATSGPVPAAEPRLRAGGERRADGQEPGRGRRHRPDQAPGRPAATCRWPGSCARPRSSALDDAEMTWADIDAVVIGKAPDMFEGVMMPELYLADALGAAGKPMLRVHTAGSVGGSTALVAASLDPGRRPRARADRRLREAVRERRDVGAVAAHPVRPPLRRRRRRLLRAAHPRLHAPVGRPRPHRHPGRAEGPAERAARTPTRTCTSTSISFETVEDSPMLWDPIRYAETCPSSDGACAHGARPTRPAATAAAATRRGCTARRCGASRRCSPGRDQVNPQGGQRLRGRRLPPGRHHRPAPRDRRGRDLRAVLVVRADVAGEPRLRRRGRRAGSWSRRAPPRSTATSP